MYYFPEFCLRVPPLYIVIFKYFLIYLNLLEAYNISKLFLLFRVCLGEA